MITSVQRNAVGEIVDATAAKTQRKVVSYINSKLTVVGVGNKTLTWLCSKRRKCSVLLRPGCFVLVHDECFIK